MNNSTINVIKTITYFCRFVLALYTFFLYKSAQQLCTVYSNVKKYNFAIHKLELIAFYPYYSYEPGNVA